MGFGSRLQSQSTVGTGVSPDLTAASLPTPAEASSSPSQVSPPSGTVKPPLLPGVTGNPAQELTQVQVLLEQAVGAGFMSKAAAEILLRKYQSTDTSSSQPWSNITRAQVEQAVALGRQLFEKFGAEEAKNRIDQSLTHDGRGFAQLSDLAQSGKLFETVFSFFQANFRPFSEFLSILQSMASPVVTLVTFNKNSHTDERDQDDEHNHDHGTGGSAVAVPTSQMKPHVVAAGREIASRFSGITEIYGFADNGGGHGRGVAFDFMVPVDSEIGLRIAEYAMNNHQRLGVKYVIWGQRIWNVERDGAPRPWSQWRMMEDRGSVTENHRDHPHVEFFDSPPRGSIA